MKTDIALSPEHESLLKALIDLAIHDPENFRLNATKAYGDFSPADRATTRALETNVLSAYTIFNAWQGSLRPLLQEFETYRLKPAFHKSLAKYLLLDSKTAAQKVDQLISARRQETLRQFTRTHYPVNQGKDKQAKTRHFAYNFFQGAPRDIEALQNRYIAFLLHQRAAEIQSLTITDPHAPWLKRKRSSQMVSRERRKTSLYERDRLKAINEKLAAMTTSYNGLVGIILDKDWDLIVILGLRNQYEKKIQSLADEAKSPLKRLEVFEKVTKEFRDTQVEKMAMQDPSQNSLGAARNFAEIIDSLLLQIFDLTNTQKNQLLVLTKEARELNEERASILAARTRREQLLQQV